MDKKEFIRGKQREWFERIQPFLTGKSLNVGSGFGYFSENAQQEGHEMTSLEVSIPFDAVNKTETVIYDGKTFPFADKSFDTSLAMYVLHHAPRPIEVLNEMKRVSAKRIILVDELYKNFFGKLNLVRVDFLMNSQAGLKSDIHWGSYFAEKTFKQKVEDGEWEISHYEATPMRGWVEVLCVLDRKS